MLEIYKSLVNWLNHPYSYREEFEYKITIPFIIGFVVFFIFYFLKPFGFGGLVNHTYFFISIGVITSVVILLFLFVITPIFPVYFSKKTWTVKKEILTLSIIIFIVGSLAWFIYQLVSDMSDNRQYNYVDFLKYSFSIGTFPVLIYVYLSESFLLSNGQIPKKETRQFNSKITPYSKNEIVLHDSNKKDYISFLVNDLVYVKSQGNYVSFYIKNKDTVVEKILRIRLKTVEKELKTHKKIIRFHKSYITNIDYVTHISGNAKGYFLHLSLIKDLIPVSRKFTKTELERLL